MKLYEFEGKSILQEVGISIPEGRPITEEQDVHLLATIAEDAINKHKEVVVKAQTLSGGRGKAGGIAFCKETAEITAVAERLLNRPILNEKVTKLLIEEKLRIKEEWYLGIIFSQEKRLPILLLSKEGGVDVEEIKDKEMIQEPIDYLKGITEEQLNSIITKANITEQTNKLKEIIKTAYFAFKEYDMKMIEINPLALTNDNKLVAADAVVVLDDAAQHRWKKSFPERAGIGRELTENEITAKKIDEEDHRGIAGRTYIDLPGDIGILASGGGASITSVDALISYGGKPANYTEYSGNPPAEKVEKLTRVVLSKPLNGLWIIGGTANFTRIDITIGGIIDALRDIQPDFPIVVRRGGPGEKEAFDMLEKAKEAYELDITFFDDTTSMTASAEVLVKKVKEYKKKKQEELKNIDQRII